MATVHTKNDANSLTDLTNCVRTISTTRNTKQSNAAVLKTSCFVSTETDATSSMSRGVLSNRKKNYLMSAREWMWRCSGSEASPKKNQNCSANCFD